MLRPTEYKRAVRECAISWRNECADVREAFEDKAAYEQSVREEAKRQPLPAKIKQTSHGEAAFDAAALLGPKALEKISIHRLVVSYRDYMQSSMWGLSGLGLASSDGCLRLDSIDLATPDKDLCEAMDIALRQPAEQPHSEEKFARFQTCQDQWGHCKGKLHTALAAQFVKNFGHLYNAGILAT